MLIERKLKVLGIYFAVFLSAFQLFAATPPQDRPAYAPQSLTRVREQIQDLAKQGMPSVVIFDLDDTVINTRERNLRLLQDFARQPSIQNKYPNEVKKLDGMTYLDVRYLTKDTLNSRGIENEDYVNEMNAFWAAHFFTNEYCARDLPFAGAAEYVTSLTNAGATVVYLTGRNWPGMGQGTALSLFLHGFPMDPLHAVLMMKPQFQGDDLEYKVSMFSQIAKLGTVVASFENEPVNINTFQTGFPDATMIFLDTSHSPKPIVPNSNIYWVADFRE